MKKTLAHTRKRRVWISGVSALAMVLSLVAIARSQSPIITEINYADGRVTIAWNTPTNRFLVQRGISLTGLVNAPVVCNTDAGVTSNVTTFREQAPASAFYSIHFGVELTNYTDEALMDDLQHRIFNFFWNEYYPETGIAIDHTQQRIGNTCATGFELAAMCIGVQRGWITWQQGYDRVWQILNTFYDDPGDPNDLYVEGDLGMFWHFLDGTNGQAWRENGEPIDCVSICDSTVFFAGVLVAGQFFKGTPVATLAQNLFDAAEWDRFILTDPDGSPGLIGGGWLPGESEGGTLLDGLSSFVDVALLIYALALGSETHGIPQETWEDYLDTCVMGEYEGYECARAGPLFCRQMPHAFIRFSRKRDRKLEYFLDTVNALLADQRFNILANGYPPQLWGLNDAMGKDSYHHSAPPGSIMNDGTVAATSFAGGLPHIPEVSMDSIRYVVTQFSDQMYGPYGFTSTLNTLDPYVSPIFMGIELGPMLLLIENYRSGSIWDLFMNTAQMRRFVSRANMSGVVDNFELPPEAPAYAEWEVDGATPMVDTNNPHHGKKCLRFEPTNSMVVISAVLPANDLLQFSFTNCLSAWLMDLMPTECAAVIDGQIHVLTQAVARSACTWYQYSYRLPPVTDTSRISRITLTGSVCGSRPALDDLLLESQVRYGLPPEVPGFVSQPGSVARCLDLKWVVPVAAQPGDVVGFRIGASRNPFAGTCPTNSDMMFVDVPIQASPGSTQSFTLALNDLAIGHAAVATVDQSGLPGAFCQSQYTCARTTSLFSVVYDFDAGDAEGWNIGASTIGFTNVPDVLCAGSNRCLAIAYNKTLPWDYLSCELDTPMVNAHRYLILKVRGNIEFIAKLFYNTDLQQDISYEAVREDGYWTVLKLDLWSVSFLPVDPAINCKLFLFPAPGLSPATGTFYIDDLLYGDDVEAMSIEASNDGWLYVNGERCFVKGVCYFEAHWISNQWTRNTIACTDYEFRRIREAGFNAVRSPLNRDEMALARKYGLLVLTGVGSIFNKEFTDPAYIDAMRMTVRSNVEEVAAFDNIICYSLDNEPCVTSIYTQTRSAARSFYTNLANAAQEALPGARTTITSMPPLGFLDYSIFDCIFLNLYPWFPAEELSEYSKYGEWFKRHYASDRPFLVSEFGWTFYQESQNPGSFSPMMIGLLDEHIRAGATGSFFYNWREFGVAGGPGADWIDLIPNALQPMDYTNAARPILADLTENFEAIIIEPAKGWTYITNFPVVVYGSDRTASMTVGFEGQTNNLVRTGTYWWETSLPVTPSSYGPATIDIMARDAVGTLLVAKQQAFYLAEEKLFIEAEINRDNPDFVHPGGHYGATIHLSDQDGTAVTNRNLYLFVSVSGRDVWDRQYFTVSTDSFGDYRFVWDGIPPGYFTLMAGLEPDCDAIRIIADVDVVRIE